MVTAALLLAASLAEYTRSEHALTADWRRLRAQAHDAGLTLQGEPATRSGWPLGADLAVERLVLQPAAAGPTLLTRRLLLQRRLGSGRSILSLPDAATISLGGSDWRIWGDIRAFVTPGAMDLHASALGLTANTQPDHVVTIAHATAVAHRDQISVRLDHLVLPFAAGPDRTVERIAIDMTRTGQTLWLRRADIAWGGSSAHLQGCLIVGPSGTLSGRLNLMLDAGWRDAIGRAVDGRLLTQAEGRAATGLLSILTADGVRELPLAVQDGRITLAGLLLFSLPAMTAR